MKKTQMIKNIYLDNDKETREIGFKLGKLLKPGSIVCLIGDLGAGKTTMRSEERRVGKECRSRWSPYH